MAQHGPLLIVKLRLVVHYCKDLLDFLQLNLELLESDAAPFPKERAPMIADSTAGGVGPRVEHTGCETEQGIPWQTRLWKPAVLVDLLCYAEQEASVFARQKAHSSKMTP